MEFVLSRDVEDALSAGDPVVALESTVISHGLPYPENLSTALRITGAVSNGGALPAVVAMLEGVFHIGLGENRLEHLARGSGIRKLSIRDIPVAAAKRIDGATTVAATAFAAEAAGLEVFATGGIGGVHRGHGFDISADLPVLADSGMIVVCSGAKAILDLAATREWLETHGVPVIGYGCDEMPAFYSRRSGLSVDVRADSAEEVVRIAEARDAFGLRKALLVTVPVPVKAEIPQAEIGGLIESAAELADNEGIFGKDLTPYLLAKLAEISGGRTVRSNIELLVNNAAVAAGIAVRLCESR